LSLLPFDLSEILHTELMKERRTPDGLAHAASDLVGSLRHTQLSVAGAPTIQEDLVRGMPLWIGHLIHEDIHRFLRKTGVPYMAEVSMTPWLPPGWGGTLDALVWNPDLKAFVMTDFKTSKGESMRYLIRDGAKQEHIAQTSLYWHAARKMGVPLAKKIAVFYLPKNETRGTTPTEPALLDFDPLPARQIHGDAKRRFGRVSDYEKSLPFLSEGRAIRSGMKDEAEHLDQSIESWLTDELEPVQPREQRAYFDRASGTYELKLVPNWSTAYCPFDDALCDCRTQGTEKLGTFDTDGTYYARKGYEHIEPLVTP
jgi:hypothetical protein